MLKEFKTFLNQGNVLDLAVGVMIGAAFGKVVSSVVDDLVNPLVGIFMGKGLVDKFTALDGKIYATYEEAKKGGGAVFGYGTFINNVVSFVITAFIIFLIVKAANKAKKPAPVAVAETPADIVLLGEIRDLLKK
ncbi:MAG: large conductance mechanosensitive channel protein MscL [Armatimonadetes bacterium]|nr:large conductance mechanosensitive channel protein MscL [Armatimonadota bacterium]